MLGPVVAEGGSLGGVLTLRSLCAFLAGPAQPVLKSNMGGFGGGMLGLIVALVGGTMSDRWNLMKDILSSR
jgi:hypothetical protein